MFKWFLTLEQGVAVESLVNVEVVLSVFWSDVDGEV